MKKAQEVGRKGIGKYIWARCEDCKEERWVQARGSKGNYKPESDKCHKCSVQKREEPAIRRQERFLRWASSRQKEPTYGWWDRLRRKAGAKGIECLTFDDFNEWYNQQDDDCYYCERPFGQDKRALDDETIDRLNNQVGYIASNMVLACRRCNLIKGSWFTAQQMIEIANEHLIG